VTDWRAILREIRIPLFFLAGLVALAFTVPLLPLADPALTQLEDRLLPPLSPNHWLGTDELGRDLLSRLLHGLRLSLGVAMASALIASFTGGLIGMTAGYLGGRIDGLLMRSIDLLMSIPYLILALAIVTILGPGLFNALLAIAVVNIPFFARAARGLTLGLNQQPFIAAARLGGQSTPRILFQEIFPNVFPVLLITTATTLAWMLLETAGLSFLGLGAQPPQADLGAMLAESRTILFVHPHVALAPGLLILFTALAVNRTGDALRDAMDPHLQHPKPSAPSENGREGKPDPSSEPDSGALLEFRNYHLSAGTRLLVKGLSLRIMPGETVSLVGESGSGKSITAMSVAQLLPEGIFHSDSGTIFFDGKPVLEKNLRELQALRQSRVRYIFQDPLLTFNPLLRMERQMREMAAGPTTSRDIAGALDLAGLPDAGRILNAFPHELSGGQRQRVAIAMALANRPRLIIADEPTTALDVTVQKQIFDTLMELQEKEGFAVLLISHDLPVVRNLCDRIYVMQDGCIVDEGEAETLEKTAQSDYTRRLLAAAPTLPPLEQKGPA